MTHVAPPPPPIHPFVYSSTPAGWVLIRPDTRPDRLLRHVQRFLAACLVLLGAGLAWTGTKMNTPGDIIMATLFTFISVGGALIVGWWMSTLGARRIERHHNQISLRTIGFFGIERQHHIGIERQHHIESPLRLRAAARTVRGRSEPTRGYALTLEAPSHAYPLGFIPANTNDRALASLSELLDAELEIAR